MLYCNSVKVVLEPLNDAVKERLIHHKWVYLFPGDAHVVLYVREDCGLQVEAFS